MTTLTDTDLALEGDLLRTWGAEINRKLRSLQGDSLPPPRELVDESKRFMTAEKVYRARQAEHMAGG